jgi:hypothetical protein
MMQTIAPGLPAEGFVRMQQIVGDPGISEEEAERRSTPTKRVEPRPPAPGILPVTEQHLRHLVRLGQFPAPVKLGPKVAVWKVEEVRAWIAAAGAVRDPPRRRR